MRKLFGTDGIRGVAGEYPLDRRTIFAIGLALASRLGRDGSAKFVIGQDTRESSCWIADALIAGLEAAGGEVRSAGVVTTPAIAYLARTLDFAAGIVISASHNPWQDNGIKVFGHDGFKLADALELEIEQLIFAKLADVEAPSSPRASSLPGDHSLAQSYERWLASLESGVRVDKLKIVVDSANGAASAVAPELFQSMGMHAQFIHFSPDGRNINEGCGALHPEEVARRVVEARADMGVCFDGDADRALFADHTGKIVNGDAVLLLISRHKKAAGTLKNNTVVATTMSNMALESLLKREGITMLRAAVGDKYVLEDMQASGAVLGGEQSGHIIFADLATTGDGILTALKVIEAVVKSGKPLAELTEDLRNFPQTIRNIRVREKKPLDQVPAVAEAIKSAELELGDQGRIVVRYSGTESLCRVMVEASSQSALEKHVNNISAVIQRELGAQG